MGLFSSDKSFLGIDIGTSSVKVVELENFKGRPKLVTYGFTEKDPTRWNGDGRLGEVKETAEVIESVCRKSRISSRKAIAAISNFSVFTSVITLPEMPKKELASAITWEAKKIIPMPLEELILDWKVVGELPINKERPEEFQASEISQQVNSLKKIFSKPKKNLKILLTGSSKVLVQKYIGIFKESGLDLLSLETENFALIRSLVGNDKSIVMVVDLGASTSSVSVVEKGIPLMNRSIKAGGFMVSRSISENLNVNMERAEQFKQDLALGKEGAESSLPKVVEKSLETTINEIKYTLNLYQQQSGKKVEKIILTGGASLLGNLSGYLSKRFDLNVHLGDPWARVVYPTELKPILDRLGARFAVAIGLAMRNIE